MGEVWVETLSIINPLRQFQSLFDDLTKEMTMKEELEIRSTKTTTTTMMMAIKIVNEETDTR